jgi:hypothetical protein
MVPAAYVQLEALPLTPNGKLDRRALPAPEADAYSTRGYEAPQGETETRLAQIWTEVLKLDKVGRHDNFFQLGGGSLSATRLLGGLRKGFPGDAGMLALATFFANPTIASTAELITMGREKRLLQENANQMTQDCGVTEEGVI